MTTPAIARIDEEINKHKSAIFNLYTQRNSLSFIFRLPTEILAIIFIHCARDHHEAHRSYMIFLESVPNWVNVSYVCRYWRDVALDCSTLWSYVFMPSLRWTEELLARSKEASLKICVRLGQLDTDHWWSSFVEKAMNHAERIQDISLHVFDGGVSPLDSKFLSSCAPHLQRISITGEGGFEEWSSLFNEGTPVLRTLKLSGYPVPWKSFKLNGLTTLHLKYVLMTLPQTVEGFLAALSDMQDLRHLYLEGALASACGFPLDDVFNAFPKINLPRLSGLLVVAPLSTVVALLSCVNIPPKTELRLECHRERDFSNKFFTLLSSHLAQRFTVSALSGPPIRSLVIMCRLSWSWRFTFSTSEHERSPDVISPNDWGCNIPLKVVVDSPPEITGSLDRIISMLNCCSILLTNVQSLDVPCPPFSSVFWTNVLGRLQNLRTLKLSDGQMPDLASVLSTPHEYTESQGGHLNRGPNELFAPALEELELSYIEFAPGPAHKRDFDAGLQSLYDALSTRKEPRGRLTMTRCNIAGGSSDWRESSTCSGGGWVVTSI